MSLPGARGTLDFSPAPAGTRVSPPPPGPRPPITGDDDLDDDEWRLTDDKTNWDDVDDDVHADNWVYCFSKEFKGDTYSGSISYMPAISVKYQLHLTDCVISDDDCVGIVRTHTAGPATFELTTNGKWQNSDYAVITLFSYDVAMDFPSLVLSVPIKTTLQPFCDTDIVLPNNHISMNGNLEMMAQYQSASGWHGHASHDFTFNNASHSVPNAEVEIKLGIIVTPSIDISIADKTLYAILFAPITMTLLTTFNTTTEELCLQALVRLAVKAQGEIDVLIDKTSTNLLIYHGTLYNSDQHCMHV